MSTVDQLGPAVRRSSLQTSPVIISMIHPGGEGEGQREEGRAHDLL